MLSKIGEEFITFKAKFRGPDVSSLHKKWRFSLRISSVNMITSAVYYGCGHIYWRNPQWKILINDNQNSDNG